MRMDSFVASTVNALALLRAAGERGHPSPGKLAEGLAEIMRARLGPRERLFIASAAFLSLDRDHAAALAEAALAEAAAGQPVPAFDRIEAEADAWTSFATLTECRAYLAAVWRRLPAADRRRFLDATGRAAA